RRNVLVVRFHCGFERLDGLVYRARLDVGLGGCTPHHHAAINVVRLPEVPDVLAKLLCQVTLGLSGLHVRGTRQARDVLLVRHGGHWREALEEVRDGRNVALLENPCSARSGERVSRNRVPAAEYHVVQVGKRHEVTDAWRALVRSLSETDGGHLRERANGLALAASHAFNAGNECCGDSPKAGDEHAKPALGRCYRRGAGISALHVLLLSGDDM